MISKILSSFLVIIIISSDFVSCSENVVKNSKNEQNTTRKKSVRDSRFLYSFFFPIPNLIPFSTVPPIMGPGPLCSDMNGEGQCVSAEQCSLFPGGTPTSACAPGRICCLIKLTWDNAMRPGELTVTQDFSTLENAVGKATRTTYHIPRQLDVCQIKLEFKKFILSQPETTSVNEDDNPGECRMDTMVITGADNLTPSLTLCGNLEYVNTFEHLYLHYGSSQMISVNLNLKRMDSSYSILVSMIKCGSPEAAPSGCTQYYTHPTDEVRSFNFPYQQLNDQHYSVCVQANSPTSVANTIKWSTCKLYPNTDEFFISGNAPFYRNDCAEQDTIMIPGSPKGVFCGGVFPTVESSSKPFFLFVDFDKVEVSPIPTGVSPGSDHKCPDGFECKTVSVDPTQEYNGTHCSNDPTIHICELDLSDPNSHPHVKRDMSNSGFCLQYTRM